MSVKSRNPHLMSCESLELSKDLSVRGFFGKYHAVIIFVAEDTSGPLSLYGDSGMSGAGLREQAAVAVRVIKMTASTCRIIIVKHLNYSQYTGSICATPLLS